MLSYKTVTIYERRLHAVYGYLKIMSQTRWQRLMWGDFLQDKCVQLNGLKSNEECDPETQGCVSHMLTEYNFL